MNLIYLAILFPLLGVLVNGFFGRRMPRKVVGTIASIAIFGSFLVSLTAFVEYLGASTGEYGAVALARRGNDDGKPGGGE